LVEAEGSGSGVIKPKPIQGLRAASPPLVIPPQPRVPTKPAAAPPPKLIQSSGEFVAGFVAPSYTLDGILQERFCYSLTAATGAGKTAIALRLALHVALGRNLGDRDVKRGGVLYFPGNQPSAVSARKHPNIIKLAVRFGLEEQGKNAQNFLSRQDTTCLAKVIAQAQVSAGCSTLSSRLASSPTADGPLWLMVRPRTLPSASIDSSAPELSSSASISRVFQ
jgi:AAA domain